MKKVIITAPAHNMLETGFRENGFEVVYAPDITYDALMDIINEAEGLVVTTRIKVDKNLLDAAPNLQWIGRLGSGLELIDTVYATQKGIRCMSTPEGNCTAVGEQALLMLLALKRHLVKAAFEVKKGLWLRNENRGTELGGIKVGIVGYGHTGAAFAKLLAGCNLQVLAYDPYKSAFSSSYISEASLDQVKNEADVISFHVPLTDETKHMANLHFFNELKRNPIILNTSRGAVINTADLVQALQSGQVSAAGLDVLENEKLGTHSHREQDVFNALKELPQVLLTPHIAGYSHEAFYKMSAFLLEKLGLKIG